MATKLDPVGIAFFYAVCIKFVNGEELTLRKVTNLKWEKDIVTMVTVDAQEWGYTFIQKNILWIQVREVDRTIP